LIAQLRAKGGIKGLTDPKRLVQQLVKDTLEALLEVEMEEHLGYSKHDPAGRGTGNSRNGATSKAIAESI